MYGSQRMTRKEKHHLGQRQLPGVTEYEEKAEARPRGMPPLSEIKSETAKLGLPDSDAEHLYDTWLVSGFKTARGTKVQSWTAAIRLWYRAGYFPSQKKSAARFQGKDHEAEQLAKLRRLKNGDLPQ